MPGLQSTCIDSLPGLIRGQIYRRGDEGDCSPPEKWGEILKVSLLLT